MGTCGEVLLWNMGRCPWRMINEEREDSRIRVKGEQRKETHRDGEEGGGAHAIYSLVVFMRPRD